MSLQNYIMNEKQQEVALQSKAYTELYNEVPAIRGRLCAVNNNSENAIKGAMNKAMGVYPGVSDMFFVCQGGRILWLECKLPGGKQSQGQKDWQKQIEALGHSYSIWRSKEELWGLISKEI